MQSKNNTWFSSTGNKSSVLTKRGIAQVHSIEREIPPQKCPSFHSALKLTIIIGQCFGLNPVLGVCEEDTSKLRFSFKSWRCAYTFLSILGQIGMTCLFIINLFKTKTPSVVDSAGALTFYLLGLLTTVTFLRVATKWPKFCVQISQMEATDPNTDSKLRIKLNVSCCVILMLALTEHLLSVFHVIYLAKGCDKEVSAYEGFVRQSFPWVYLIIPHNNMFGLIISHFLNLQFTFNWNFSDIFIICMSLYLISRLEQVTQKVVAARNKVSSTSLWRSIREDYNDTAQLVRRVDILIGGLIFLSFASNLLFICSQLLHTLSGGFQASNKCKDDSTPDERYMLSKAHPVYFAYSFAFLLARSLAVTLTAARVHSASLEPAYALYSVSPASYCIEIERFLDQIHGNTVALSGLRFFSVKRGLILTIAATVVTYELVLMQFTGLTPTPAPPASVTPAL